MDNIQKYNICINVPLSQILDFICISDRCKLFVFYCVLLEFKPKDDIECVIYKMSCTDGRIVLIGDRDRSIQDASHGGRISALW
jgi:hypothetical protein